MPLVATRGAASAQGFGEFAVTSTPTYIEDVFSCFLYTGNGTTNTIVNGLDLSGKGGLVWIKGRNTAYTNLLFTSGLTSNSYYMQSNGTNGESDGSPDFAGFNSNGFSLTAPYGLSATALNGSGNSFVSWSLRKQPKFFDIQTWSGSGSNRTISHALGSVPACIMVKRTNSSSTDWQVYHRSLANTEYLVLNSTAAKATGATRWNSTTPTSTEFSLGTDASVNASGGTYVAYLFAHNAGGFGLTGTDNVISCGSFTTDGSGNAEVNLGYEPQWLLVKANASGNDWYMYDNMRGLSYSNYVYLSPNLSAAEGNIAADYLVPTATGFKTKSFAGSTTYIYIAIRRGPMKVPTSGTSVFSPNTANASAGTPVVTNFPVDLSISVATAGDTRYFSDRLRGVNSTGQTANQPWIASNSTGAELTNASIPRGWDNTQILVPPYYAGGPTVWWNMRRAPSFFDEVCYTVSGFAANNVAHNLTVTPELFITKPRGSTGSWTVYGSILGATNKYMTLNDTQALQTSGSTVWGATSSTFSEPSTAKNGTYVCYLFATCAGVSKVGSYTGNGSTQTINCGFTGGARFVLIKRTDSTGDWYVWDTARGIVSGNDSYLLLNSTAAEVTNTDYIDTYSAGFEISSTAPAAINANGGSFIFLAIS